MEQNSQKSSNKLLTAYKIIDYVDYGIMAAICIYLFNRVSQWQGYANLVAFVSANRGGENNLLNQLFHNINDVETALSAFGSTTLMINFLFLISLTLSVVGFTLTVKLQRQKLIPLNKAIFRYIWWGIMGPIEILAILSF
jgi:hypothetical protein